MPSFSLDPLLPYPQRSYLLELASRHAQAVDEDRYCPLASLQELAARDLLIQGRQGSLLPQAALIFDLASKCMATAFSLWAHRACITFFDTVGKDLPEGLTQASISGSTAMAQAFKDASGLGSIQVRAQPVAGGLKLNGSISWASNLYPDGVIVLPVILETAQGSSQKYVVSTRVDRAGLTVKPLKGLLALNATQSGSLTFKDLIVPEADILTTNLPSFLAGIRSPFLLLQSSFCLGLTAASLEAISQQLRGGRKVFTAGFERISQDYHRLRQQLISLAEQPESAHKSQLLQLRHSLSQLAIAATHLELAVFGGRAYSQQSASNRRLRESLFLPVQSPTEGHLRHDLALSQQ